MVSRRKHIVAGLLATAFFSVEPVAAQDAIAADDAEASIDLTEEIIVTAQKRAQNLQDVALNVTALGGDDLTQKGVENIDDLAGVVPGVHVLSTGASSTVFVRGIGSGTALGDPSVAFHLDGVYIGRGSGSTSLMYDIQRVEVLKGPQGTLYGRNAAAGAVNVISNAPVDRFEARLYGSLGNYDYQQLGGMINVVATDGLAFRLAFERARRDGYLSNGASDQDATAVRGRILAEPVDNLSILVTGDYFKAEGIGGGDVPLYSPLCGGSKFCDPDNPYFSPADTGYIDSTNWGLTAEISWDLEPFIVVFQPAYRHVEADNFAFQNGLAGGAYLDTGANQTSFELRLASSSSRPLEWVAGAYYLKEDAFNFQRIQGTRAPVRSTAPALDTITGNKETPVYNTEAYAVFAQATYSVSDALRLTGGLRYTKERKAQEGQGYVILTAAGSPAADPFVCASPQYPYPGCTRLGLYPITGSYEVDPFTWKAGLEYDAGPDSLLYVNVGKGVKAGGLNQEFTPNVFRSETLQEYALGSKNRFFDRRVTVNGELYYWNYDGQQINQFGLLNVPPGSPPAQGLRIVNLGKKRIYGVDVDASWAATENDRLNLSVSYTNSRYKNDPNNLVPATRNLVGSILEPATDFRGLPTSFSPKWAGTIGYEHEFELQSGSLTFATDTKFSSSYYTYFKTSLAPKQSAYATSNASLTFRTENDRLSVSAYVRNLQDKAVLRGTNASTLGGYFGLLAEPRTYGVRTEIQF